MLSMLGLCSLVFFLSVPALAQNARSVFAIPLTVTNPVEVAQEQVALALRLHLPQGVVFKPDLEGVVVFEREQSDAAQFPSDVVTQTLVSYNDGSIREVTLHCEVTIQPSATRNLEVLFGVARPGAPPILTKPLTVTQDPQLQTVSLATAHGAYVLSMRSNVAEPITPELPDEILVLEKHYQGALADFIALNSLKIGDRREAARIVFGDPETCTIESSALAATVLFTFSAKALWQPAQQAMYPLPERVRAAMRFTVQRGNPIIRVDATRTILETVNQYGMVMVGTLLFETSNAGQLTYRCGPQDYYKTLIDSLTPADFERVRRSGLPKASVLTANLKRVFELSELNAATVRRLTESQIQTMAHWFSIDYEQQASSTLYLPRKCCPPTTGIGWNKARYSDREGWALGFGQETLTVGELWNTLALVLNGPYLTEESLQDLLKQLEQPLTVTTGPGYYRTWIDPSQEQESEIIDISKLTKREPQSEQPNE